MFFYSIYLHPIPSPGVFVFYSSWSLLRCVYILLIFILCQVYCIYILFISVPSGVFIFCSQVLCKALAAVQHFLFLCCFLWMSLEALLLFLSVRRLKRVNSHLGAGPHWGYNLLIGYGVPLVVVGVSASVFPDGYGSQQ